MRRKKIGLINLTLAVIVALSALPAFGQNAEVGRSASRHVNTNTRMLYHDGLILLGPVDVYFIWYGCWDANCGPNGDPQSQSILTDFMSNLGGSPYYVINMMYPDGEGRTPSGQLFYGGGAFDRGYSRGVELTAADIQGIIADKIVAHALPQDPNGIYVVLASADVGSSATGFCVTGAQPHHGIGSALGSDFRYAFVGNPVRCPAAAAPQFLDANGNQLPTPNGSLAGDALASTLAHVVSTTVTNPTFSGWFDRYGLENADKCMGEFGTTYLTTSGARANLRLGQRDYLLQQNWVNDKKGHCGMDPSL